MKKTFKLELEGGDFIHIQHALEMLIDYYQTSDDESDKLYAKDIEETYDRVIKQA